VISVGTADEYVEGTLDKTGLTISRMAEEIAGLDAVVSNDSGVMNVANALGVPLVALFGPTNPVTRGPISADVRILTPGTGCAPCEASREHEARFNDGKCQCIRLIGVDRVIDALRSLGLSFGEPAIR
jgi:ADP-heptose:LPS heptosyltransferase